MFSFEVVEPGPYVRISVDGSIIDESGPWESVEAATSWATAYVNRMNAGVPEPVVE